MKETIEQKKEISRKIKAGFLAGAMGFATVLTPMTFTACPTNKEQEKNGSEEQKGGYTIPGVSASIIKEIGVTDAEMTIILEHLTQAYNGMSNGFKNNFNEVINFEIRVIAGSGVTHDAVNKVLKIGNDILTLNFDTLR